MEVQAIKSEISSAVRKTNRDQAALVSGEWAALPLTFADLLMQMFQPCQASLENPEGIESVEMEKGACAVQNLTNLTMLPQETLLQTMEDPLHADAVPNGQQFSGPPADTPEWMAANAEEVEAISELQQAVPEVLAEMGKTGLQVTVQKDGTFDAVLQKDGDQSSAVEAENKRTDIPAIKIVPKEKTTAPNVFTDTQGRVALASRMRKYELPEEPQESQNYSQQMVPAREGFENVFNRTAAQNVAQTSQNHQLLNQICSQIKEKVSLGEQVFSMKLNPESMGEITIKLQEEGGKTVLHITALNAQTTQLINNELPSLREILSPMQVRVQDASTQEQTGSFSQMADMQQHFGANGQAFGQRQEYHEEEKHPKSMGRVYSQEIRLPELTMSAMTDGLDTYV